MKGIPQSSRLRRYVKIHATIIQCAFPPFEKGEKQKQNKKFDVCLNRKYVENKRDPRGIDRQRYGAAKCQRRGGANAYRLWLYSLTMTLFFFLSSPISSTTKARFSQVGLDARDAQHRQTNGTKLFF